MPTPEMYFRAGFGLARSLEGRREQKRAGGEKRKAGRDDYSALEALVPQVLGHPEATPKFLEYLARPDVSARVQSRVKVPPQFLGLGESLVPPVTAPEIVGAVEGGNKPRAEVQVDPTFQRMQAAHLEGLTAGAQAVTEAAANEAIAEVGTTGNVTQAGLLAAARANKSPEYRLQQKAHQERTGIAAEATDARITQKLMQQYMDAPEATGKMYAQLWGRDPAALARAEDWRQKLEEAAGDEAEQAAIKAIVAVQGQIYRPRLQPLPDEILLPHAEALKSRDRDDEAVDDLTAGRTVGKPLIDINRARAGAPTTIQYKNLEAAQQTAKRLETQMWSGLAEGKWNAVNDVRRWMHDVISSDKYKDAAPLLGRLGAELDAAWGAWVDINERAAQRTGVPVTPATGQTAFNKMPGYTKGPKPIGGGTGKASGKQTSGYSAKGEAFVVSSTGEVKAVKVIDGNVGDEYLKAVNLDGTGNQKGYDVRMPFVALPRTRRYEDIKLKQGMERYRKSQQGMAGGWAGPSKLAPATPAPISPESVPGKAAFEKLRPK